MIRRHRRGILFLCAKKGREEDAMPDWIWIVALVAVWVVLNRWVLPRFGVRT
jgi:predicted nucleic acid-binding Zn ribbon protein